MDLLHAPYLFFMGAGEFSVIKDSPFKGKEVSYYEKEYAPFAKKIFGNTPEMIKFFSEKLGVDFPGPNTPDRWYAIMSAVPWKIPRLPCIRKAPTRTTDS